ncbi:Hypothetical protein, putative [Bodo saltans]|uniref:Uncharacterized protein n=1 Tax=Bodo saltans TaxID=75058 RepID=A0A0S4IR81_BODSA|nr:Hypothetical protein, putative [Bodo saltans]|eukprot:CUF31948.1 Hypothetical protein, putative [Bodo saltans]
MTTGWSHHTPFSHFPFTSLVLENFAWRCLIFMTGRPSRAASACEMRFRVRFDPSDVLFAVPLCRRGGGSGVFLENSALAPCVLSHFRCLCAILFICPSLPCFVHSR